MLLSVGEAISVSLSKEIFLFWKTMKLHMFIFSGAEKRTKRDIHPHRAAPYIGRA
jgi:hypothetical protein